MDTPSPDAFCPPLEQTRNIVESRLGTLELEGTWRATYVLVHRERGDVVTLQLHDPSGRVRLEREFAAKDGTCSTLAQVIALVLERYFLRPEATVDESTPPDTNAARDQAPAAPEQAVDAPAEPLKPKVAAAQPVTDSPRAGNAESGRMNSRAHVALDASLWASTAWIAPSVGIALQMNEFWGLGLKGGYDLSSHTLTLAKGWGKLRRIPLTLQATRQLVPGAPLRLYAGAELLGLYEHVYTEGIAETGSGSRLVPGVGLQLGAEPLRGRTAVFPFLELSSLLLLRSLSSPFEVDHRPVFTPPTFVFGLDFGIRTLL